MAKSSWLRILLLAIFINAHQSVLRAINKIVPDPYLDEVFHIPQAQRYWQGEWTQWDPKITTPPGIYVFSYIFNSIRGGRGPLVSTEDLRFSNAILLYALVVALTSWTVLARRPVDTDAVLQREIVIVSFPLLFFFSTLYYTDLFSALSVILSYLAWEAGNRYRNRRGAFQLLNLVTGLLALACRQTNVFWVSIFLAGMQVVESVKTRGLHDPDVSDAYIEDIFYFMISLVKGVFATLPTLILDLWPQIALLACFSGFILWNGGVVLGDKQNHVATLHTPQLLYIWPMMVFFSWPAILSSLAAQLQPEQFSLAKLRSLAPRASVVLGISVLMLASVHFNTIVHPFTLADNRHFTFYVFRILTKHKFTKYAVVPIYLLSAWLVFASLNTAPSHRIKPRNSTLSTKQKDNIEREEKDRNTVPLSFALIWFISTGLSLVTAPLVEPRYFIVPWLIWRIHIPVQPTSAGQAWIQRFLVSYGLWLELAWYTVVNVGTIYIFLEWGFAWPQEPGNIQRFMW